MSVRLRSTRRLICMGLVGMLLVSGGLLSPNPAAAKGPKPAVLTLTAEYAPISSDNLNCGLRLTAGYTGGKGKYTLTYQLRRLEQDGSVGTVGPQTMSIRRSASPVTIIQGNSTPQGRNPDVRIEFEGELRDGKGNLAASFPRGSFPLVNC